MRTINDLSIEEILQLRNHYNSLLLECRDEMGNLYVEKELFEDYIKIVSYLDSFILNMTKCAIRDSILVTYKTKDELESIAKAHASHNNP